MRSRYRIKMDFNSYFIASTIVDWTPLLFNNDLFTILSDSLKYCQKEKALRLYGYVILPNHFHLIIGHEQSKEIPYIVRDMKKFTSKAISKYLKNLQSYRNLPWLKPFYAGKNNTIWQAGYHPKAIFNETVFIEKINYIHNNPVKLGFVEKPEDWKYTSARNYILEDHSMMSLDTHLL